MKKSDVLKLPSMPLQSPTFPRGPYRFFRRQYLVVSYQSDAAAIREALPEPLVPAGDTVAVQWLDLPDGEGFGAYSAAAQIIPCTFKGEPCNFVSQMYVDNTPPLAGGREIWGYPMKYGKAVLKVTGDTLTGTLDYATQRAATGTMVYKHDAFRADLSKEKELLARTQVTLKMIPDIVLLPSPAALVAANERLSAEIAAHRETLASLDRQVRERTADLEKATAALAVQAREAVHRIGNIIGVMRKQP